MSAPRKNIMLGTAGHVDHGKSALVKLLTGCETDTLAEEKQRGLTVDLGFAPCRLADDRNIERVLITEDDGGDPRTAALAAQRLTAGARGRISGDAWRSAPRSQRTRMVGPPGWW